MRFARRLRDALAAGLLFQTAILAGFAGTAAASGGCGAEGCPFEAQSNAGQSRRFSFDLAYQSIDQDKLWDGGSGASLSGLASAHSVDLETRTRAWTGVGVARITDRLVLSGALAYFDRDQRSAIQHHSGFFVPYDWNFRGLGDLAVTATLQPFAALATPTQRLSVLAGIKLPTGRRHVDPVAGTSPFPSVPIEPSPGVRPGSGSVDGIAGVQYSHPLGARTIRGVNASVPLTLGAATHFAGKGTDGYRVGNETQLSLDTSYPMLQSVRLLGQLSASFHGRDDAGTAAAGPHHSGGRSALASPGVRIQWTPMFATYGFAQFRVYEHSNGPQVVAPFQLVFGSSLALGF